MAKKQIAKKKTVPSASKSKPNTAVVYQTKSGALELRGDFSHETVWATQAQIAEIFEVTPQNITQHIAKIYKENELSENSTCKESLQVQDEGGRSISRISKIYNLDIMIAVGYRINSIKGTQFRQWATKTLKEQLTKGYTLNKKIILKNIENEEELRNPAMQLAGFRSSPQEGQRPYCARNVSTAFMALNAE